MDYRNGSCVFCKIKFDEKKDYDPLNEDNRPFYMGLEGLSTHCTCLCLGHFKCANEVLQKQDSKCPKCHIYFDHIYELDFALKHIFKDIDDEDKAEKKSKPGVRNAEGVLIYTCGKCKTEFTCRKKRFRCEESHKKPMKCPHCTVTCKRVDNLNRHIHEFHSD